MGLQLEGAVHPLAGKAWPAELEALGPGNEVCVPGALSAVVLLIQSRPLAHEVASSHRCQRLPERLPWGF